MTTHRYAGVRPGFLVMLLPTSPPPPPPLGLPAQMSILISLSIDYSLFLLTLYRYVPIASRRDPAVPTLS